MANLIEKSAKRHYFNFENFYSHLKQELDKGKTFLDLNSYYHSEDNYFLGQRIAQVRAGYYKLTDEQIQKLTQLNFIWDIKTERREYTFNRLYNHLLEELPKVSGDWSKFTTNYECEDGYILGRRLIEIRCGALKLREQDKQKLDALGYPWKVRKTEFYFEFNDFIKRLKLELEKFNGDWTKLTHYYFCADGYPLGEKIHNIRGGGIKLNLVQRKILEDMNFTFKVCEVRKFVFEEFFEKLVNELEIINNDWSALKPGYKCADGYKLGSNVIRIRTGSIKLTNEQINKLNSINFAWHLKRKELDFNLFLTKVKEELTKNNGDWSKLTQRYVCEDGYRLGNRFTVIRTNPDVLTEEQKQTLTNLGFKLKVKQPKFKFEFEDFLSRLLKAYNLNNQNWKNITTKYVCEDGYPLGDKIASVKHKNIKLNEKQINRLASIGFSIETRTYNKNL